MPEILKDGQLPEPLIKLRDEKYTLMPAEELRKECKVMFNNISVSDKQCENVQKITREQAKCKEWHRLRMGRITASNMKSVCTTSIEKPALSTVNSICGRNKFKTKATEYGCRHEQQALQDYTKSMNNHENVTVMSCGLFLNPEYPYLGATPDALVSCSCCGQGIVEIKCPYCARDNLLSDCAIECLQDGRLKPGHRYEYQVQTQLTVTKKEYCDFVIWSAKDIFVQRIVTNQTLENEILEKSKNFFINVILPELTGCLITRERNFVPQKKDENNLAKQCIKSRSVKTTDKLVATCTNEINMNNTVTLACICGEQCKELSKNVIRCDNENCKFGLLHFKCVNLKRRAKSPYYCPECRRYKW